MRWLTELLTVAAFVAWAAGGVGTVLAPASAEDRCEGVWVVVDARDAGGSLTTRCAPGDPTSGIQALDAAGHTPGYVPNIPGFVCTIDARPDPCNGGPSDAHWSYWTSSDDATWTYSLVGAASHDPDPGTVEGWRFGDGSSAPGATPPGPDRNPDPGDGTEAAAGVDPAPRMTTQGEDVDGLTPDRSAPEGDGGWPWGPITAAVLVLGVGGATVRRRARAVN